MMERTFGHFSRVLVDLDVTQELQYKVLVERKGYAFFVDLDFENIPDFCTNCRKITHHINICKSMYINEAVKDVAGPKLADKESTKEFVQVHDGRTKQGSIETEPIDVDEGNKDDKVKMLSNQNDTNAQQTDEASASKIVKHNKFDVLVNEESNIRTEMIAQDT